MGALLIIGDEMTEAMFVKTDDLVYENQHGDVIDAREISADPGFLLNGDYITYKSVLYGEIGRGEYILNNSQSDPCPQKLKEYGGYSWVDNFGVWTVKRDRYKDLILFHDINGKRIGSVRLRDYYSLLPLM